MKGPGKLVICLVCGLYLLAAFHGVLESLSSSLGTRRAMELSQTNLVPFDSHTSFMSEFDTTPRDSTTVTVSKGNTGATDVPLDQDKLVLAMIAFGNATRGTHVQRAIRSARARGEWKGRIAIITDSPEAYAELTKEDPRVHLIAPRREDWEAQPEFGHAKMRIKRFKTLLIDYINEDLRLQDAEFILYLDVDIVVCQPLVPWLHVKWAKGNEKRKGLASDMSTMYMFSEGRGKGMAGHSGLILLHRDLSRGCLLKWRELFDKYRDTAPRDQWLVRKIRRFPQKMNCMIDAWWPHYEDFLFPEPKHLEQRSLPQFVHITNTFRAKMIHPDLQKAFLEDALMLSEDERRDPKSLAVVPELF